MPFLAKLRAILHRTPASKAPSIKEDKLPRNPKVSQRPMKELEPLKPLGKKIPVDFIKEVNKAIAEINAQIRRYNEETRPSTKKEILLQIQNEIKRIDCTFPHSIFSKSPSYVSLHSELYEEIQYQLDSMTPKSQGVDPELASSPAELFKKMSPEKANALFVIIMQNRNRPPEILSAALKKLYEGEEDSPEKTHFNLFVENYILEWLSDGNSKCLKLRHKYTGVECVLKISDNLDVPRTAEYHLRDSGVKVRERLSPIRAERLVSCPTKKGGIVTATLQVMDFYPQGDLANYVKGLQHGKIQELKPPGKIFEQMAGIFLDLQEAHTFFTDAKVFNWLIDEHGELHIADTKSLLPLSEDGTFHRRDPGNKYCRTLCTEDFCPPEYANRDISADSAHAYMLGKNLYYCITRYYAVGDSGSELYFNSELFGSPMGKEYQALIEALVQPNPKKRMSVRDALDQLFILNNSEFKEVISDLKALKFGPQDACMNKYIREQQDRINQATSSGERTGILKEMQDMVHGLKADEACMELKNIVDNYKHKGQWFYFKTGMKLKASQIESAMSTVPLEDRCHFLESKHANKVMHVLASNRGDKTGEKHLDEKGRIDPEKAEAAFKQYKNAYQKAFNNRPQLLDKLTEPADEPEDPSPQGPR